MGPLVPDIINDQLNLILAFLLGIAFGFVLEQAGFSSSRKLTGLFYGTDFTVLRVFFTAGVTALSGVLILGQFGLLDTDLIYVNPMFFHSAVLGGLIMGLGFVLGGYCPGTGICAAAVGKVDGIAFVIGGLLGIFAFGEAFPWLQEIYQAGAMGGLLVNTVLGVSAGQFAALLIVVAVGAFMATSRIEKKVNPEGPAGRFPVRYHRAAAVGVVILGLVLAAVPDRKARLTARAAEHAVPVMAADELAIHVLDRDPNVQIVDVRSAAEFAKMSLPGAVNIPVGGMFGKDWRALLNEGTTKVFVDRDQAGSMKAASLAGVLGYRNVVALQGGWNGFDAIILRAQAGSSEEQQFRFRSGPQIAAMIRARATPPPAKALKRVQGGCGS